MNYQLLNKYLKNFNYLRNGNTLIKKQIIRDISREGSQGDSNLSYEIYKLPETEVYIKLEINSDSYGDNEFVAGVEFVKPVEKVVTRFETI